MEAEARRGPSTAASAGNLLTLEEDEEDERKSRRKKKKKKGKSTGNLDEIHMDMQDIQDELVQLRRHHRS